MRTVSTKVLFVRLAISYKFLLLLSSSSTRIGTLNDFLHKRILNILSQTALVLVHVLNNIHLDFEISCSMLQFHFYQVTKRITLYSAYLYNLIIGSFTQLEFFSMSLSKRDFVFNDDNSVYLNLWNRIIKSYKEVCS